MALKRAFIDTTGGGPDVDVTDGSGPDIHVKVLDGSGSHYKALDDRMLPCNFTCRRREVGGVTLSNF